MTITFEATKQKEKSILLVYSNTHWEFLRRVTSIQGQSLIPKVRWSGARTYIGGGQKITAEAGDYVWIGSGPSGMVLLPDQVQISAADVYMKSPLNWIHKIIDEETTETLLDLYEEMKTAAPPIYAPDGTLIRRDGYDDILYSEELYDYFLNHVVGKEEKYKRENGEPYVTLYEQWLDETYGHSAMWYFWDYVFSIDGLQTMLDIGGFFFDGCDLVNAAIYLLRGRGKEAAWSFVGAVPLIGSVIMAKKGTKLVSAAGNLSTALKTEDAVTGLTLTYKVEEKGTEFLTEVVPVVEEMCGTVKYSQSGLAAAGQTVYKDLSVTTKMVDDAGEMINVMLTDDIYALYRKISNTGDYKDLKELMQLKHVKKVAKDAGIGVDGIKIKIDRNADLLGKGIYGFTDGKNIILYPDAFTDIETLVKTLGHERMHVYQISIFGKATSTDMLIEFEKAAYNSEKSWWDYYIFMNGEK